MLRKSTFYVLPDLIFKNERDMHSDLLGDQFQHGRKGGALFSDHSN